MSARSWALTEDVPTAAVIAVIVLAVVALGLLLFELRRRERYGLAIALTGIVAVALLVAAVLRPVRITGRGSLVGPRIVVLLDQSRRLLLPDGNQTRRQRALLAARDISKHLSDARLTYLGFGDGPPRPVSVAESETKLPKLDRDSDLVAALSALGSAPGERPQAIVVVSDGRLTRPPADHDDEALKHAVGGLKVPLHTVSVAAEAPKDASIHAVRAAGAAVAHQSFALTVDVVCAGGLQCDSIPVTIRELLRDEEPAVLASGVAKMEDGKASVQLTVVLERAGARVVEVSIDPPDGDTIVENNTRIMTFSVTRDRIRLLHVAGRPTYDVRALRRWLKSDESVDLVAFFILRTKHDETSCTDNELALIPFPVHELFTQHLPSFDAVMLQDIDAVEYELAQHLENLGKYVRSGGGLIMIGGPSAFVGGSYADGTLGSVLPIELEADDKPFDVGHFTPVYTEAGRAAPVLRTLRQLYGDDLPEMPGSNTLGKAREGAIVLWEHPKRKTNGGAMPVLALGEAGDGRAIALGVDGTHLLAFSEMAAEAGGRGFGALWDGLLGWLMRDPRYEPARMELTDECVAGQPVTLRLIRLPGSQGDVEVTALRLGVDPGKPIVRKVAAGQNNPVEIELGLLKPGGYTVEARIGRAPPTRFDFACEPAGASWSDTRPDPERLRRIAAVTGGKAVTANDVRSLPMPEATEVAAERHVSPIVPPWAWTLSAALMLGMHWLLRRRGGLA